MSIGALRERAWLPHGVDSWWSSRSLAQQFGLVSSVVVVLGMAVVGIWVARKIEDSVVQTTAATNALYINAFIAPHLQELARNETLSPKTIDALDAVVAEPAFALQVRSVKVWRPDGVVVYSNNRDLIGRAFTPDSAMKKALKGRVAAHIESLDDEEDAWERSLGVPLFETYSPVRQYGSARVIGVVEFYQHLDTLAEDRAKALRQSWLVTGAIGITLMLALSAIVSRGSHLIERQRKALVARVDQLSDILRQNEILRSRFDADSGPCDDSELLRRLGSELHDGPAQLLSLALLRLDAVRAGPESADFAVVKGALQEALKDIRNVCAGLILPEVHDMSLAEALNHTLEAHERRTGTKVMRAIAPLPEVRPELKAALARFVQEGLHNACKHAGGKGQRVAAQRIAGGVVIEVADSGPGVKAGQVRLGQGGLGLLGLRDRIEALGGRVRIVSRVGVGTRLIVFLPTGVGSDHVG